MNLIIGKKSSREEAAELAERHESEGAFVLWLEPNGGVKSGFQGTPKAGAQLGPLLRHLADDYERQQGRH